MTSSIEHRDTNFSNEISQRGIEQCQRAIDSMGIASSDLLVIGGSVLAAHGIRAAHDVDLLAPPSVLLDVNSTGTSPSGRSFSTYRKRSHVLTFGGDDFQPKVELMSDFDPSQSTIEQYTNQFSVKLERSDHVGALQFETLEANVARMIGNPHIDTHKTKTDLQAVALFLQDYVTSDDLQRNHPMPLTIETAQGIISAIDSVNMSRSKRLANSVFSLLRTKMN